MKSTEIKGIIALIVLALILATMGVFSRFLNLELELFQQIYLRIAIALLLCLLIFSRKINYKALFSTPRKDILILSIRAFCFYFAIALITKALIIGKYSNASFIGAIPILPLIGYFILKEKISLKMFMFILLAFIGVGCISIQGSITLFSLASILALISAILYDTGSILRKFHSDHLNNYEQTSVMLFFGVIFLFIGSLISGESIILNIDISYLTLLVLCISASFNILILLLINYSFKHVKASIAGNILTLEVLFALSYGILFYSEILTIMEIIGSIIILTSVLLVNYQENKENKSTH